ncbi:hypothetical protein ACROYT_G041448 [Oculina patagonica]
MAEAPRNQLPSGYDENFVNAVEEDFQCLICHLSLKEPVLTRCGHRFCKDCLEEHFRRQRVQDQPLTCPADREGLDQERDVFPDKATERKILSLLIECPSDGCEWTGELRSKEVHLTSCLCKLVPCTNENCQVTIQRKDLESHAMTKCPWRVLECDYCSEPHPECQDHTEQCTKFPVFCPNHCGASFPREMVSNHTERDCPLTMISCPYAQMGCKTKVQRREVQSHLQTATRLHLDLACVKLNNTEIKLNNTEVKLNETQVKLNDTEVKLNNTEETTKKLMEKLNTLQRQFEEKVREDREEVVMIKRDSSDFSRMFIWKVSNFSDLLRQAKTEEKVNVESSPFYTESYGYRLKVSVYPNGDGLGKNTRLSIYIRVMEGEYDAILPWPFKMKVKLTIIDQQEDSVERENVSKELTPELAGKNFGRPMGIENKGCGFSLFITHKKLNSRRYLVDDALFIQVEV